MKPVLNVSQLTIQRGATFILKRVDWRVQHGEHWVILGANGSGKTSLLSALTGYLMPTEGDIAVLGRVYGRADWRELRKRIGLVSTSIRQRIPDDEPALATIVSGKEAVIDFRGRATAADLARARRILRQVEASQLAERPWLYLSQGERQRILIGRALMARPRLLILDEPCAGLDPAARRQFLDFIQRLGNRPDAPTLVLVTHHVEEIMPVFSHVLVLRKGTVLAAGKKSKVMTNRVMTAAFGVPARLQTKAGHYALALKVRKHVIL